MSKEHIWPIWLIDRAGADKTGIRWIGGKKISPRSATLPICRKCNHRLGSELEGPVSHLFEAIENGDAISDWDAELLIRWMWKIDGLGWIFNHPTAIYTLDHTFIERVLRSIDPIRGNLRLAISIIEDIDPGFDDAPMGLDSSNIHNAIFVAGVFSRIAMMVLLDVFERVVPDNYSIYPLQPKLSANSYTKIFKPKAGFKLCTEAVAVSREIGELLSDFHDRYALELVREETLKKLR